MRNTQNVFLNFWKRCRNWSQLNEQERAVHRAEAELRWAYIRWYKQVASYRASMQAHQHLDLITQSLYQQLLGDEIAQKLSPLDALANSAEQWSAKAESGSAGLA